MSGGGSKAIRGCYISLPEYEEHASLVLWVGEEIQLNCMIDTHLSARFVLSTCVGGKVHRTSDVLETSLDLDPFISSFRGRGGGGNFPFSETICVAISSRKPRNAKTQVARFKFTCTRYSDRINVLSWWILKYCNHHLCYQHLWCAMKERVLTLQVPCPPMNYYMYTSELPSESEGSSSPVPVGPKADMLFEWSLLGARFSTVINLTNSTEAWYRYARNTISNQNVLELRPRIRAYSLDNTCSYLISKYAWLSPW